MSPQDIAGVIGIIALCVLIVAALTWPGYDMNEWDEPWRLRATEERLRREDEARIARGA